MAPRDFTRQKDRAQILTKPYVKSGGKCRMEFWYYMNSRYGNTYGDPGTINVFLMQGTLGDKVSFANERWRSKACWIYNYTFKRNRLPLDVTRFPYHVSCRYTEINTSRMKGISILFPWCPISSLF